MRPTLLLIIVLCSCALAQSCEADNGVELRLTSAERREVDSRVRATIDSLRPILDSICAATTADRIAVATDSIVQERLEEELRLRARLPQNAPR